MAGATILQLGAGALLGESIRILCDEGFKVHAIDRDPDAPGFALADCSEPIDFGDVDAVTNCARRIGANLILGVNELGVWTAAQASARLGLPNVPVDVAWRCLHKGEMRAAWQRAGLSQPAFRVIKNLDELPAAADALGYPLVLKPTFGWGSRGVSVMRSQADLPRAAEFAREHARQPDFIVEQMIVGTELTIEGLVQHGRPVVLAMSDKQHQRHDQYCVAMALDYPPDLPEAKQREVEELVKHAVAALGLHNGAFHCECMTNAAGDYLVELGARGGGGHIFSRIVETASGVCMPSALTRIFLGEDVDLRPKWRRAVSYRFFAPPEGVFLLAENIETARRMPNILEFGFNLAAGTVVRPISGDADRPGFVISTGVTRQEAIDSAQQAIGAVRFVMSESTSAMKPA
ncbi:MAG: ATP-grasp domain-containing protein [Planctomycetota bacterium]